MIAVSSSDLEQCVIVFGEYTVERGAFASFKHLGRSGSIPSIVKGLLVRLLDSVTRFSVYFSVIKFVLI